MKLQGEYGGLGRFNIGLLVIKIDLIIIAL